MEQVEGAAKITIRIFKSITLVHDAGMVLLEVSQSSAVRSYANRPQLQPLLFRHSDIRATVAPLS